MARRLALKRDERTGLYYRPGSWDLNIIREQAGQYGEMNLGPGDDVLDLGGNIGAFACLVARGCNTCTSYEPEGENYLVMQHHLERGLGPPDWSLVQGAVVGSVTERWVPFYVNKRRNKGTHRLRPTKGRAVVHVPAEAFEDALGLTHAITPNAVKCDIEGGEYDLPWRLVAEADVDKLAIEFHFQGPHEWREQARSIVGDLAAWGFTPVRQVKLDGGHWTSTGVWRR